MEASEVGQWRQFGDLQEFSEFFELAVALILHYLLTGFYLNK